MKRLTPAQYDMKCHLSFDTCGEYNAPFFDRAESPDFDIKTAITDDLTTARERIVLARRKRTEYGLTEKNCSIKLKHTKNVSFKTGKLYDVYIVNVILWKADNGEAESQYCN